MTDSRPNYALEGAEVQQNRLQRKFKESPLFVIGIGGWCGLVAFGLYKVKTRPANVTLAMHLIQTRVIAQTAVIGGVTIGVAYSLGQKLYGAYFPKKEGE